LYVCMYVYIYIYICVCVCVRVCVGVLELTALTWASFYADFKLMT